MVHEWNTTKCKTSSQIRYAKIESALSWHLYRKSLWLSGKQNRKIRSKLLCLPTFSIFKSHSPFVDELFSFFAYICEKTSLNVVVLPMPLPYMIAKLGEIGFLLSNNLCSPIFLTLKRMSLRFVFIDGVGTLW